MALDAGKVVGTLELQDKWNTTLEKAAANTQRFEATATAALTRASASTQMMTTTAIGLQGRLAIAEAASRSMSGEIQALSASILAAGGSTNAERIRLNNLTAALKSTEEAAAGFKSRITELAGGGSRLANVGTALHQSFGRFDSLLSAMGVNLGTEARALSEVAGAAGTSAAAMGALATAGVALGVGIASWKITTAATEFFNLNNWIESVARRMFGFADAATAAAGAQADVLAKATRAAGIEIKDLALAMEINGEQFVSHAQHAKMAAAQMEKFHGVIAQLKDRGVLADLAKDLEAGNIKAEDLAKIYGEDAVAAFRNYEREQKALDDAAEKAANAQHARNERMLRDTQTQFAADQALRAFEAEKLAAATRLWEEYADVRLSHGGTANQIAIAQIDKWAAGVKAAAEKAGFATKGFYDALAADSREKMAGVGVDWDLWRTKSIPALQEVADNAQKTLNAMIASGKFNRDMIDQQRQKWEEAKNAVRGYGIEAAGAQDKLKAKLEEERKKREELLAVAKKQREEEEARRMAGGSFDVTSQNIDATIHSMNLESAKVYDLLHRGLSLQQAIEVSRGAPMPTNPGPRVPGFASGVQNYGGGLALVGERGPELVNLPRGADVMPASRLGGGASVVIHVDARGAWFKDRQMIDDLSRDVADRIMFITHLGRRFGTA